MASTQAEGAAFSPHRCSGAEHRIWCSAGITLIQGPGRRTLVNALKHVMESIDFFNRDKDGSEIGNLSIMISEKMMTQRRFGNGKPGTHYKNELEHKDKSIQHTSLTSNKTRFGIYRKSNKPSTLRPTVVAA